MVSERKLHEEEEEEDELDDVIPDSSLPVPPDGGWGWVIVAASFVVNLIVDGVCYSFGVFYVEYLAYFQASKAKTTLVGALLPSIYLMIGPVVSALANKFGCRVVTMIGGVITCAAFILSTFSTTIEHMIVILGVFGGIGFGFMYLPSIVIVSFYFDKRRALATGIAVCGSGVGTFVLAPISEFLLNEYGWKGANWILGGIILNTVICGALFRPLEPPRPPKSSPKPDDIKKSIIMQKIMAEKARQRTISTGSLDNTVITAENLLIKDPDILRHVQEIIVAEENEERKSLIEKPTEQEPARATPQLRHKQLERLISEAESRSLMAGGGGGGGGGDDESRIGASMTSLRSVDRKLRKQAKEEANRPMYRQDIFFTGSVTSIAEYKSTQDMSSYMSSIASVPSLPKNGKSLSARCLPFLHTLRSVFDLTLFKSITFVLFLLATGIFAFAGFFVPYLYIVDSTLKLGISQRHGTFLLSIIGIANVVGRIASGWLADRPWADAVNIHNIALLIAGIVTIILPFLTTYWLLCIYAIVFGLCIAAFIALRSIVAVELLGIQRLTNSFGLMILFQGVAGMVGSPVAGPLVSALANKYGCRPVSIAGSIVACIAFFSSTFATTIDHMIVLYGVLGGIGFGFMYLPSIVIVSFYFDKKRALATGIAVCGSGLGTFVLAPLGKYLIDEFGWKGANWILAGIMLNCGLCGALYRPLEPPQNKRKKKDNIQYSLKNNFIMQKIIAEKERQRTLSTGSLDNTIITAENMHIKDPDILQHVQEAIAVDGQGKVSYWVDGREEGREPGTRRRSLDSLIYDENVGSQASLSARPKHRQLERLISRNDTIKKDSSLHTGARLSTSVTSLKSLDSNLKKKLQEEANRPMDRQDIFFTGSVTSIAEYKSTHDVSSYVSSIASVPTLPAGGVPSRSRCFPFLNALRNMFDVSLFKSPTFIILLLFVCVLAFSGFFVPYLYIVENALLLGHGKAESTFLLSIIGIANIVGRILAGWLADRPWADSVFIHNAALLGSGLFTCLVPLLKSYVLLCVYAVLFGVCIAAYVAMRSIVAVELLGLHRLTNSFGLMLLFQGAASLVGSPMAGALFDATKSYTVTFLVAGSFISVGALFSFSLRRVSRWENTRSQRHDHAVTTVTQSTDYIPVPAKDNLPDAVKFNTDVESAGAHSPLPRASFDAS